MFSPKDIKSYIESEGLFNHQDRLLLAVSGGADSMVMWDVLRCLGYKIAVAHVNFQLRGEESDGDQTFVEEQGRKQGVVCHTAVYNTKKYASKYSLSIQAAARKLRYDFFDELSVSHGYDYILTAHHIDDRIETFWMNFARGATTKGLSSLRNKVGKIRRPLLARSASDIRGYTRINNILFREDSSNREEKYQRNAFRRQVMPLLHEMFPRLSSVADRNLKRLEEMHFLVEAQIEQLRERYLLDHSDGSTEILWSADLQQHPALPTLMFYWLKEYGFNNEQVRQIIAATSTLQLASSTHGLALQQEKIIIFPKQGERSYSSWEMSWEQRIQQISLCNNDEISYIEVDRPEILLTPPEKILVDKKALQWPLQLRYPQPGDRFQPYGTTGHQKLSDYFINANIPRYIRPRIPVLLNGEGTIIWVVGCRMDHRFRVKKSTTQVVAFNYKSLWSSRSSADFEWEDED